MKTREFKQLLDDDLVASIRVVPIPLADGWCIDVLIKERLTVGSHTDILESTRSTRRQRRVRRFASIDSAARYLKQQGVNSFNVDLDDSISFVIADQSPEDSEAAELDLPDRDVAANM